MGWFGTRLLLRIASSPSVRSFFQNYRITSGGTSYGKHRDLPEMEMGCLTYEGERQPAHGRHSDLRPQRLLHHCAPCLHSLFRHGQLNPMLCPPRSAGRHTRAVPYRDILQYSRTRRFEPRTESRREKAAKICERWYRSDLHLPLYVCWQGSSTRRLPSAFDINAIDYLQ